MPRKIASHLSVNTTRPRRTSGRQPALAWKLRDQVIGDSVRVSKRPKPSKVRALTKKMTALAMQSEERTSSPAASETHETASKNNSATKSLKKTDRFAPASKEQRARIVADIQNSCHPNYTQIGKKHGASSYTALEINKQLKFFPVADVIAGTTQPTPAHITDALNKLKRIEPKDVTGTPFTLKELKKLKANPQATIKRNNDRYKVVLIKLNEFFPLKTVRVSFQNRFLYERQRLLFLPKQY